MEEEIWVVEQCKVFLSWHGICNFEFTLADQRKIIGPYIPAETQQTIINA